MTLPRRLSASIVDYRATRFARHAVQSLVAEWLSAGGARDALDVVVVDNAPGVTPRAEHAALEAAGARVVVASENLGYARGANLALEHARFRGAGDWIAVLNPDVGFLPGSLAALFRGPFGEDLGVLAPATFVDPTCELALPPHRTPSVASLRAELAAEHDVDAARRLARRRAVRAERVWGAREPLELPMLSGAALFLPAAQLARLGGLFDPRYPLYYEDTDLARRACAAGLACVFEPRARIVHHWARSSGVGAEFEADPRARFRISLRAYFERWHGAEAAREIELAAERAERLPSAGRCPPIHPLTSLGAVDAAPELVFPRAARWLVELALTPHFPLAAGALVDGRSWRLGPRAWEWLFPGRYFVRALDRDTFEVGGAWSFDKTTPARQDPLTLDETARDRGDR